MSYYPATVVLSDERKTVVRLQSNGHQITFVHASAHAAPAELREPGALGFVSFPKAPAIFTAAAA
jgi:hypothetical protein